MEIFDKEAPYSLVEKTYYVRTFLSFLSHFFRFETDT